MKTENKQYDDGIFKVGALNIPTRDSLETMSNWGKVFIINNNQIKYV
jgi:hypothetical protein